MDLLVEFYVAMMFVALVLGTISWRALKEVCAERDYSPLAVLIISSLFWPLLVYVDFRNRLTEK